jgi:hypothetical protein
MLNISLSPRVIPLIPGADASSPALLSLTVLPITRQVLRKARDDSDKARAAYIEANPGQDDKAADAAWDAYVASLAHAAVIDWSGVGDENDMPVAFSIEALDRFLSLNAPFNLFADKVVIPARDVSIEKNVSSPSSGGSTAAKDQTATSDAQASNTVEPATGPTV